MGIRFDYNNVLDAAVGREHGLTLKQLEGLSKQAARLHETYIRKIRESGKIGFFDLPYDKALANRVNKLAREIRGNCDTFVVLGIGGSALGPICVHTALRHYYHNFDSAARGKDPRLFVVDNSDPELIASLLDIIDLKKTVFNVISKSGTTPETMTQFMVFFEQVASKLGKAGIAKRFVATTDESKGFLRRLADEYGLATLPIPDNVGGRFSEMTAVGLLPAAVSGVNINQLLAGAAEMDKACSNPNLMQNPAYLNAAIHYLLDTKKGKSISVMMPYSNALRDIADWYRQLWAESLGKKFDQKGNIIHAGQTPVKALGATDQHSQVQLYAEGPNDKIINFIEVENFRRKCSIPKVFKSLPELDFMTGSDMGQLLNYELAATEFALTQANRPNVRFTIDKVTPQNIGGLLYLFEVQTAFAGGLYGIDAFDQPGVEEGKKATNALMGRGTKADKEKSRQVAQYLKGKKIKPVQC
ncbi:glucose-6-phosphate isomerase [Candidatus Sumerlaeota bacterium]|nr:glucose-6-phosphate isomerase [Candidatus Sumerlaeota bacterium]